VFTSFPGAQYEALAKAGMFTDCLGLLFHFVHIRIQQLQKGSPWNYERSGLFGVPFSILVLFFWRWLTSKPKAFFGKKEGTCDKPKAVGDTRRQRLLFVLKIPTIIANSLLGGYSRLLGYYLTVMVPPYRPIPQVY
jgi:hypothetical protein